MKNNEPDSLKKKTHPEKLWKFQMQTTQVGRRIILGSSGNDRMLPLSEMSFRSYI